MKLRLIFLAGLVILTACALAASEIHINVEEHTLKNGMKVLILPRHNLPVFTGFIQFNAGSVMEKPGITGISHLLEHMMFKGTHDMGTTDYKAELPFMKEIDELAGQWYAEKAKLRTEYGKGDPAKLKALEEKIKALIEKQRKYIVKNELWGTYLQNGAQALNASTGNESVQYYVSLPANRLELWAYLESDRMAHPVLREFYSERDVVNEERRMGDNEPSYRLLKEFLAMAFASSPYRAPVVGYESDITTVRREDAQMYFKTYYAPNNAVAVIVGDVKPAEVMKLIRKYFEPIPAQKAPDPMMTCEVEQQGERRIEMEADAFPFVMIGWHGPKYGSKDEFALDVLSSILSDGRTSRLYRNLVEKQRVALAVGGYNLSYRYASLFIIRGMSKAPRTTADLEKAIYAELERLKTEPVEAREIEKVCNNMEVDFLRELSSNLWMAFKLGGAQTLTGDWRNFDQRAQLRSVTADDIMRVARTYFVKKNRTVATLTRASSSDGKGEK
jgi:predicted Zn-dependent peptidase